MSASAEGTGLPADASRGPPPVAAASPGPARTALVVALFVAGYVLLDAVSYIHPVQRFGITPWNPQPALAIALLMALGARSLPAVFVAALAAERVVRGELLSLPASIAAAAALTAGYAAIAYLLAGPLRVSRRLDSRRDVLRLAGTVAAGALATGILYVGALLASGTGPVDAPVVAVVGFWIGDAIGILVTLPLLLMLQDRVRRAEIRGLLSRGELAVQCAAIVAIAAVAFVGAGAEPFKYFYLLFLPLVWVAARSGMAGVAVAAIVTQGAAIVAVALVGARALTTFELQALLMALTFTGFFLGVTVDERRRAADDLKRTLGLAVAGEMSAAIAHELNQPLLAVANYAKAARLIASAKDVDRALLDGTLDKLVAESKRAADVVRRLRDLFRVGGTSRADVDPWLPVSRAIAAMGERAARAGVALEARAGASLPSLRLDAVQIELVVANLVHNAIDAAALAQAKRPGAVAVEAARAPDGGVVVSVVDSGEGIAEADAERIFEPLASTKPQGMGMGLTIARAIVEAHGGAMWAEPASRGIVRFSLPAGDGAHG